MSDKHTGANAQRGRVTASDLADIIYEERRRGTAHGGRPEIRAADRILALLRPAAGEGEVERQAEAIMVEIARQMLRRIYEAEAPRAPGDGDVMLRLEAIIQERDALRQEAERAQAEAAQWSRVSEKMERVMRELWEQNERMRVNLTPRPIEDWHEDHGNALWWTLPIKGPPYVGTPLDADWPHGEGLSHWTPLEWLALAVDGPAATPTAPEGAGGTDGH